MAKADSEASTDLFGDPHRSDTMRLTTRHKYPLDEATSTLIKALRRGDEELALFFGLELLDYFPNHLWKRLAIFCAEDVGLANPQAIVTVAALWDAYQKIREQQGKGRPVEEDLATMAILYLARSPKHREADTAKNWMLERIKQGFRPPVPEWALDCHTQRGKQLGKDERAWWQADDYLPEGGHGKYEFYADLKKRGETLPKE